MSDRSIVVYRRKSDRNNKYLKPRNQNFERILGCLFKKTKKKNGEEAIVYTSDRSMN